MSASTLWGKRRKTGEFVGGKAIVKAVISLPSDCFKLSGTGAKTSILYLQKRHANPNQPEQFLPEPQTDVFMAVAETLGYVVKTISKIITPVLLTIWIRLFLFISAGNSYVQSPSFTRNR